MKRFNGFLFVFIFSCAVNLWLSETSREVASDLVASVIDFVDKSGAKEVVIQTACEHVDPDSRLIRQWDFCPPTQNHEEGDRVHAVHHIRSEAVICMETGVSENCRKRVIEADPSCTYTWDVECFLQSCRVRTADVCICNLRNLHTKEG